MGGVALGWNSPAAWMLDEEVVACKTFDIVEKLRAWIGELGVLLKKSTLRGVREVFERNWDVLLIVLTWAF